MEYLLVPVFSNQEMQKKRAKAIVQATTHYEDADVLAKVSEDIGEAMVGINISSLPKEDRLENRGV